GDRVWTEINQPLLQKLLTTVDDAPNVIWEVMNEPESHHLPDTTGFHQAVVRQVVSGYARLGLDPLTSVNTVSTTSTLGVWATRAADVDILSGHFNWNGSGYDFGGLSRVPKPVILSNDGDGTDTSTALSASTRKTHLQRFVSGAIGQDSRRGHIGI